MNQWKNKRSLSDIILHPRSSPAAAAADFLQKSVLFQFTEPKPKWNQADRSTVPSVLTRAEGSSPSTFVGAVTHLCLFSDYPTTPGRERRVRSTRTFISVL